MTECHADTLCHTDRQIYQDVKWQAQADMCLHLPWPSAEPFPAKHKQHNLYWWPKAMLVVVLAHDIYAKWHCIF